MNRSLKSVNLLRKLVTFNPTRSIYDRHLIYPKGKDTIQVEEDNDQKLFACIHLEPTFPYEHTKPLPQEEEEVKKPESVLRESETAKEEIYPQDPSLIEVQRMTYTSEKFWDKDYEFKKTYRRKKLKPREGP